MRLVWSPSQVNFQPFRDYWFSLGLLDTAAMHMVLSNAALHLNVLRGNRSEDITILTHNAAAIKSVNVRIRDKKLNTSDELIGAILGVCKLQNPTLINCANIKKLMCHEVCYCMQIICTISF
jgi:hypothetical protein